jgi:hypothetical protein
MKRLTIAMSDDLYGRLLAFAADQSKSQLKRISLGESVRDLISERLDELGYSGFSKQVATYPSRSGV